MADKDKTYRVFLSAAEVSGDVHCAHLIEALKRTDRSIEFVGVGGENMEAAGCKMIENTTKKAAMLYNAFTQIGRFILLVLRLNRYLKKNRPDLVIVCDSPAFNFHIAKAAKKHNIKTLFYVAPQLWAWAPWRIKKLKRSCDKLACILPFEQDWFTQRGIDTVFVGNPLLDDLQGDLNDNKKSYMTFDPKNARIALMPGSRTAEIESLWPPMQKIASRLRRKYPAAAFTAVAVNDKAIEVLRSMQIMGFRCKYTTDPVETVAANSEFTLVASGSATLQVAAAGCPMTVMYQSSKILWHLAGRWLITTKFFSLVNILANKELVPEFMPHFDSIDPIVESTDQLLTDTARLAQTSTGLIALAQQLKKQNTSETTAKIALEMLTQTPHHTPQTASDDK